MHVPAEIEKRCENYQKSQNPYNRPNFYTTDNFAAKFSKLLDRASIQYRGTPDYRFIKLLKKPTEFCHIKNIMV